jgi:hypothetical protein
MTITVALVAIVMVSALMFAPSKQKYFKKVSLDKSDEEKIVQKHKQFVEKKIVFVDGESEYACQL